MMKKSLHLQAFFMHGSIYAVGTWMYSNSIYTWMYFDNVLLHCLPTGIRGLVYRDDQGWRERMNMTTQSMHNIDLPAWARWVAMDEDGRWWCYEAEPHQHDSGWYENEVGRSQVIDPVVAISSDDWSNSLQRVGA